jgi:acyl dehydratase
MGLYFEEFTVGQKMVTEKRTITENDIMTFAALSGDDNRIHTDPEFSKTTQFGKQIAHGMLGLSIASGLAWQTGILDGTVIAFREVNDWKFVKPVFIDDFHLCRPGNEGNQGPCRASAEGRLRFRWK